MNRMIKILLSFVLMLPVVFVTSGCSQKKNYKPTKYTSAARHKATMRTYRVRGKSYSPTYVSVNDTMRGVASWYGPNFHGKQTSNGERYNMHAMTAAHKTWPMDTMVRVDNLKNGKSVTVRINDRGPFISGRIIDCSYAAGKAIGLDKSGIAPVKITVLGFAGKIYHKPKPVDKTTVVESTQTPRVLLTNFAVQVGAFRRYEGAVISRDKHKVYGGSKKVIIKKSIVDNEPFYRVWVTGLKTAQEAKDFINDNNIQGGIIVRP
ncbi:MAG: septal ring lytic transglycosylase RlpA family protein [Sulfurovum sp.]|nr:septal ring lytic transglycosylase RlpA family protein [Sulfurovum sp.]